MMNKVSCKFCGKLLAESFLAKHELSPICVRRTRQEEKKRPCENCGKVVLVSNMSRHKKTKLCKDGGRQGKNAKKRLRWMNKTRLVKSKSQLEAEAPVREDVVEELDKAYWLISDSFVNLDYNRAYVNLKNIQNIIEWARNFHDPYLVSGMNEEVPRAIRQDSVASTKSNTSCDWEEGKGELLKPHMKDYLDKLESKQIEIRQRVVVLAVTSRTLLNTKGERTLKIDIRLWNIFGLK